MAALASVLKLSGGPVGLGRSPFPMLGLSVIHHYVSSTRHPSLIPHYLSRLTPIPCLFLEENSL